MAPEQVAERRMVLENPDAPGTGIVVAAGDPIPAFARAYIENTPNKVDAAANHEVADAADQAATPVIRDGVKPGTGSPEAAKLAAEAAERTAENREKFEQEQSEAFDPGNWFSPKKAPTTAAQTSEEDSSGGDDGGDSGDEKPGELGDLKVEQLDAIAEAREKAGNPVEGYTGKKADKVAALQKAGATAGEAQ
jgi:hypothetical protein